jgi:hypothetical protein
MVDQSNYFSLADKKSKVREAYVEASITFGELFWSIDIFSEDIPMPIMTWAPHVGSFEEFTELRKQNFDPLSEEFNHVLSSNDFYFTIAGDCVPVNSITINLRRTKGQPKFQFQIKAVGNVDVLYDEEYDANLPLEISCIGSFKGVAIRSEQGQEDDQSDMRLIERFFGTTKVVPVESDSPFIRRYKFA